MDRAQKDAFVQHLTFLLSVDLHREALLEDVSSEVDYEELPKQRVNACLTVVQYRLIEANVRRLNRIAYAQERFFRRAELAGHGSSTTSGSVAAALNSVSSVYDDYPYLPQVDEDGNTFRCPYCLQDLPIKYARQGWRFVFPFRFRSTEISNFPISTWR